MSLSLLTKCCGAVVGVFVPWWGYKCYSLRSSQLYQEAIACLQGDDAVAEAIGRPISFAPYPIPMNSTREKMDIPFRGSKYVGCLYATCVPNEETGKCDMDYLCAVANYTRVNVKFPLEIKETVEEETVEVEAPKEEVLKVDEGE